MQSNRSFSDFMGSLRTQARVIGALLRREILTRYGRSNFGFMWLFLEPMMFTTGVLLIWTALRFQSSALPIVPFTLSGYATILLWRNTISRCVSALEPNQALMHHRNVRVIDVFLSRVFLEVAGASMSFIFLLIFFGAIGWVEVPEDPLKVILGWFLLAWFAMGLALLIGSLAAMSDVVERIWHVMSYLLLPVSGAFFMVEWLPENFRQLALLMPMVHGTELLRDGMFGSLVTTHYSIGYMLVSNIVLMLPGLMMMKSVTSMVEGE